VFIVDDEVHAQEALKAVLQEDAPEFTILGTAQTVKEAYEGISRLRPDVVFLDIELQKEVGFDLLTMSFEYRFEVVFVTAYDRYSLEAFKSNALSYLLKPIRFSEFSRIKQRILQVVGQSTPTPAEDVESASTLRDRVSIPTGTRVEFLEVDDIVMIQADRSYCQVHLYGGETKTISKPLAYVAQQIESDDFLRVHRSYLVNTRYIQAWDKVDGGRLILQNHASVPLSNEGRKALHKLLS